MTLGNVPQHTLCSSHFDKELCQSLPASAPDAPILDAVVDQEPANFSGEHFMVFAMWGFPEMVVITPKWMVYTWTSYENGWFRGTHLWKPPCGHGKCRTLPRPLQPCSFCGIFQVSAWALVSGRHQSCARLLPSGMQGTPDVRGGSSPSQTSLEPTDLTTIKRLTHLTNAMNDVDETQFVGSKPSANFSNICRDSRDYAMEVWSRNPVQKTQFSKEISIVCLRDEQNFHNFEPIIANTSHTTFSYFFHLVFSFQVFTNAQWPSLIALADSTSNAPGSNSCCSMGCASQQDPLRKKMDHGCPNFEIPTNYMNEPNCRSQI